MKNLSINDLVKVSVVAAIYAALTLAIAPFAYGPIQFRFAEILNLLAFFNPIYILAVTLGVFISNIFSPLGIYDMVFGTLHTLIALIFVWRSRSILTASIWPAVFSFIIALELNLAVNAPFLETWLFVGLSEILICTIIAIPVIHLIWRTGFIKRHIQDNTSKKWRNNPIWPGLLLRSQTL